MPALLYLLPEDLPTRRAAVPHPSWTHLEASGIKHSESVLTKVNSKAVQEPLRLGSKPFVQTAPNKRSLWRLDTQPPTVGTGQEEPSWRIGTRETRSEDLPKE